MIFVYFRVWLIIRHELDNLSWHYTAWLFFSLHWLSLCCASAFQDFLSCLLSIPLESVLVLLLLLLLSQNTWQNQFNDGRVYLDHSLRVQLIIVGKLWWQKRVPEHISSTVKDQKKVNTGTQFTFPILFSQLIECCHLHLE